MNAERLHIVALDLKEEIEERNVIRLFEALVSALQQIVNANNANTQQNLVNSRDGFYQAVTNTRSDKYSPGWRQILVEMGGEDLFGRSLKELVQRVLLDNQMTPGVANDKLGKVLTRLREFKNSLDQLVLAFEQFKIGLEELPQGQAEVAYLIPREAIDERLEGLIDELDTFKFFLNTLSEIATGHPEKLQVRTISSSKFMIFLLTHAKLGEVIAKCVNFIVEQYKRILEIRKLQGEIERLRVPESISHEMKSFANAEMEKKLGEFSVEIVNEYVTIDGPRKNELKTAVKFSLNGIANRIDKGFNIEVRLNPPKSDQDDPNGEVKHAFETIQAAQINMQYMSLEGAPILTLPEKSESGTASDTEALLTPKRRKIRLKDE